MAGHIMRMKNATCQIYILISLNTIIIIFINVYLQMH